MSAEIQPTHQTADGPVLAAPAVSEAHQLAPALDWEQRQRDAQAVIDEGLRLNRSREEITEGRYRALRIAVLCADRVLGFRRAGPPMGGTPAEVTMRERRVTVRWADGRVVRSPIAQRPGEPIEADADA